MKTKRFLFVSSVVLLAALCIGIMNLQYDRLSRYPYQDPQARALIDEYLSDEEISYIIEYSIAPSEFVQYLGIPGFSIYHAAFYHQVSDSIWYLNNENIVYIVELAREKMSMEQLTHYLLNYDFDSVVRYLKEGDTYLSSSVLVENPNDLNAIVDDQHTLSSRILYNRCAFFALRKCKLRSFLKYDSSNIFSSGNKTDGFYFRGTSEAAPSEAIVKGEWITLSVEFTISKEISYTNDLCATLVVYNKYTSEDSYVLLDDFEVYRLKIMELSLKVLTLILIVLYLHLETCHKAGKKMEMIIVHLVLYMVG